MKKVLEVIGKRPTGGIGSFITNYQSHFKDDKIKLDYLIFDDAPDGAFDKKVKEMGSTVYVLPELRNSRLFSIWRKINQFFTEHGRDYIAIHLHSVNIAFMVFPAAKRNGIKNLIAHSHSTVYSDKTLNAIRNFFLYQYAKKEATHYLACSHAVGDFLFGKENRDKVIIFNNAIECRDFCFSDQVRNEYRNKLNLHGNFVVGHVGRFTKEKNHKLLIDVFKEIKKINKKAILLLVGDGPLKQRIERKVHNYNLQDSVYFLGQRNDVNSLFMAMDIFVLPSLFEGLPVTGIEAQATGLPCFMSEDITREVDITGVHFVSIKKHPQEWAKLLCTTKKNSSSERKNATERIIKAGYDINSEANRLYSFYEGLM